MEDGLNTFEGRIGWPGFAITWCELDMGASRGIALWVGGFMRGWRWRVARG